MNGSKPMNVDLGQRWPATAVKHAQAASTAIVLGWLRRFLLIGSVVLLTACAAAPGVSADRDPLERFNRGMSQFNEGLDAAVLKPAARGYAYVAPPLVRTGVHNFFANLGDVWNAVNNLLQGKIQAAAETWMRINVNTIMGLGGLIDVASEMGIERHYEDFGQTLGRWGMPSGPYLVLPFFGPSTVRDALALPFDARGNLLSAFEGGTTRNSMYLLRAVDGRANLLRTENVVEEAALDKYSFIRDAFLQRRRNDIYDGELPEDSPDGNKP